VSTAFFLTLEIASGLRKEGFEFLIKSQGRSLGRKNLSPQLLDFSRSFSSEGAPLAFLFIFLLKLNYYGKFFSSYWFGNSY
jgi:hypothetical protein